MTCQGMSHHLGTLSCILLVSATISRSEFKVELVTGGISRPTYVCSPPGDTNRLFILEQHLGRGKEQREDAR